MKDKLKSQEELSEKEAQELSAYFDGELAVTKHQEIESRLKSGEELLSQELELLKMVRQEVRVWFREASEAGVHGNSRSSLWERIEDDLKRMDVSRRDSVWNKLGELLSIRAPSRSLAWGSSFAVLALTFVAYRYSNMPDAEKPVVQQLAKVSVDPQADLVQEAPFEKSTRGIDIPFFDPELQQQRQARDLRVGTVSTGNMSTTNFTQGNPTERDSHVEILRLFLQGRQRATDSGEESLAARNQGRRVPHGGFSADGVEVDWIKTTRPYSLVKTRNGEEPPVIWISDSKR